MVQYETKGDSGTHAVIGGFPVDPFSLRAVLQPNPPTKTEPIITNLLFYQY